MNFLRFPNESTWLTAASEAGFMAGDTLAAYTHDRAIDVVGTITRGGEYDPETGAVIVAPTVLAGFHVNYSGDLPDEWDDYLVTPAAPYRVFAGVEHIATELTAIREDMRSDRRELFGRLGPAEQRIAKLEAHHIP